MSKKEITAFDVALQELHAVAKIMKLDDEVVQFLETPQRVMAVNVPLRMDDGSMKFFKGYRSQHNRAIGPSRGGTRLHHEETEDDVKALSFWMTIKNSLAGIPSGGAKGGIAVDPQSLSVAELERLCRAYVRAIAPMLNPDVDVFGPDVGTPPQVMAWLLDEYEVLCQRHVPTAFSGKPIPLGGSLGRKQATGYGLVASVTELLRQKGQKLEGKTVAIQGFGNLGAFAAEAFANAGAKVIAATDIRGGIHNANGIDIKKAFAQLEQTGSIAGLAGTDSISNSELLALKCDILVPAALQNQITAENAGNVQATFVVEGANGPTTPDGEHIMLDKGITVLPDIVANCGGVLVSYMEQVQNRYCYSWTEAEVFKRLAETMTTTCAGVCAVAGERSVSLRTAAWIMALDKVISAMKLRGWIPNRQ